MQPGSVVKIKGMLHICVEQGCGCCICQRPLTGAVLEVFTVN